MRFSWRQHGIDMLEASLRVGRVSIARLDPFVMALRKHRSFAALVEGGIDETQLIHFACGFAIGSQIVPMVMARIRQSGRRLVSSHPGRPYDLLRSYQAAIYELLHQREDGRFFHGEFCQLAGLVLGINIQFESYRRSWMRLRRQLEPALNPARMRLTG